MSFQSSEDFTCIRVPEFDEFVGTFLRVFRESDAMTVDLVTGLPQEASVFPSGLNFKEETGFMWPLSIYFGLKVSFCSGFWGVFTGVGDAAFGGP